MDIGSKGEAVFAANIHLSKTPPQGACFYSFDDESACNVVALSNHTRDNLVSIT